MKEKYEQLMFIIHKFDKQDVVLASGLAQISDRAWTDDPWSFSIGGDN